MGWPTSPERPRHQRARRSRQKESQEEQCHDDTSLVGRRLLLGICRNASASHSGGIVYRMSSSPSLAVDTMPPFSAFNFRLHTLPNPAIMGAAALKYRSFSLSAGPWEVRLFRWYVPETLCTGGVGSP